MSWVYDQPSGQMSVAYGPPLAVGWSGHDAGRNNPAMQDQHDIGPIPKGRYTIGAPINSPKTGPFSLPLTPDPANEMFGRSKFLIHGSSLMDPAESSHGCIILARVARETIWASGDHDLIVV